MDHLWTYLLTPLWAPFGLAAWILSFTLGKVLVGALALFLTEAYLLSRKVRYTPAFLLMGLAGWIKDAFWWWAKIITLPTDLFGGLRRLLHFVRDVFLRIIPKEDLDQAIANLWAATKALLRAPTGFFIGLKDGIMTSLVPFVSGVLAPILFLVSTVAWDVLARYGGISFRPSAFLWWLYGLLWSFFASVASMVASLKDLPTLIKTLVAGLFGWLPRDMIDESVVDMTNATAHIGTAYQGFTETWSILGWDTAALHQVLRLVLVLVGLGCMILVFVLNVTGRCDRAPPFPDANGEDVNSDGEPRPPTPLHKSRREIVID
jgi:hypothetical protein